MAKNSVLRILNFDLINESICFRNENREFGNFFEEATERDGSLSQLGQIDGFGL